jgi:hypothetical protein
VKGICILSSSLYMVGSSSLSELDICHSNYLKSVHI